MLLLTSGLRQWNLFLIQESTNLTSKCNSAPQAAVISSVIMAENGIEGNQISRGMMDRWREVSNVCLHPLSLSHMQLSSQLQRSELSYLDAERPRTGQRQLRKCCAFARRVHASTCKWAAALAFDILRATQAVQCQAIAARVSLRCTCSHTDRYWSALSGHLELQSTEANFTL